MSSIMGGGGHTESVQNSAPWGPSQSNLQDVFNKGSDQFYSKFGTGGIGPQTSQGLNLQAQRGLMGSPLNQAAQHQNLSTINGDYLDMSKNPAAQSAMSMARSNINSQFTGDNNGNSAHQEWLGRGLMGATAPFYEAERGRQQQAIGMAPGLANNDYTDIGNVVAAGQTQDATPWNNIFNYQRAMTVPGGASTSSQPYYSNPMGNALGMGMAGMSMYGMGNNFGWWGS